MGEQVGELGAAAAAGFAAAVVFYVNLPAGGAALVAGDELRPVGLAGGAVVFGIPEDFCEGVFHGSGGGFGGVNGGVNSLIGEPFKLAAGGATVAGEASMGGRRNEESRAFGFGGRAFGLCFLIKSGHFCLRLFGLTWVSSIQIRKYLRLCNRKKQKCLK